MTMTKLFALVKRMHKEDKDGVNFIEKYGEAFADFIDEAIRAFEALCICGICANRINRYEKKEETASDVDDLAAAKDGYNKYIPDWESFAVNNSLPIDTKKAAYSFKQVTGYFPSNFEIWGKHTDISLKQLELSR